MRPYFRLTVILALFAALSACAPFSTPEPNLPPPAHSPTPVAIPSSGEDFLFEPACYLDSQSAAMTPTHRNDPKNAGVNACYELTLEIQPGELTYTGTLNLAFVNNYDVDLPDLVFRLYPNTVFNYAGKLGVNSVKIEAQSVQPELLLADQSVLRIPLPRALAPGERLEVAMGFNGQVPENQATYGIFNYDNTEETLTLANWFPMLAARDAKGWQANDIQPQGDAVTSETSLFHAVITLPLEWQVASTGTDLHNEIRGDQREIEVVSGPTRDFMVVASPNFLVSEVEAGDVAIRQWALPGNEQQQEDGLSVAEQSLALFSRQFGEYPFNELDVVSTALNNASGVEYPGLILMGYNLYDPKSDKNRLNLTLAHEVAHQWWYGLIGNDVQQDPWQDEALAMYASTLYLEEYNPTYMKGTLQYFEDNVRTFEQDNTDVDYQIGEPLSAFGRQGQAYSTIVYQKGALFFWDLRRKIGDEAFGAALKDYSQQNNYHRVGPGVLLDSFETNCGCDLAGFYHDWGVTP